MGDFPKSGHIFIGRSLAILSLNILLMILLLVDKLIYNHNSLGHFYPKHDNYGLPIM